MGKNGIAERQMNLDGIIEAFEAANVEHLDVELTEFLPAADHPLYLEARRELVRVDLELSWLDGRRKHLQDYAGMFPDLLQDRTAVQAIAFEEYRVRMLAGELPSTAEYERQYGVNTTGWIRKNATIADDKKDTETEIMLTFVQALGKEDSWQSSRGNVAQSLLRQNTQISSSEAAFLLAQTMTAMPEVGADFLDFHLIAELGSGSFGQVYLARQRNLANRPMALKITVDLQGEDQTLARLQHTNVMPIYSHHQAGAFKAVLMPFLGSATLADVIRDLEGRPSLPTSGKDIVGSILARMQALRARVEHLESARDDGENLRQLKESSYVDAVLLIATRVTEGLVHAHERRVLHRDLKPANILLTDEGEPMLLDFNLAANEKLHVGLGELQVGGTLPYMAPEHLEAIHGGTDPVDARSDLYSLGVVLFELLTGRHPFATPGGPLVEIVPAMIAARRQAVPLLMPVNPDVTPAVESMIRKCLQPRPEQRYQSAQELLEDLTRHRQDLPLRHAPEPSIRERARKWVRRHPRLTAPTNVATLAVVLLVLAAAPFAWQWNRKLAAQERLREFEQKVTASPRSILETINVMHVLPEARHYEESRVDETTSAYRGALGLYRVLEDPEWQSQPAVTGLDPADRDRLLHKVSDILYVLASAEQMQGDRKKAEALRARAAALPVHEPADERYWAASDSLAHGRNAEALRFVAEAIKKNPDDAGAWLLRGLCEQNLGTRVHAANAEAAYKTYLTLQPDGIWGRYLRGLLFLNQKDWGKAKSDFDAVLKRYPDMAWAYYHRAKTRQGGREEAAALADLVAAIRLAPENPEFYSLRAELHMEPLGVLDDLDRALKLNPHSPLTLYNKALVLADSLGRTTDAVEVLDKILEMDPSFGDARFKRGFLLAGLGKRDQAVADAERLIDKEQLIDKSQLIDKEQIQWIDNEKRPLRHYQAAQIYAATAPKYPDDAKRAIKLLAFALRNDYGVDRYQKDPYLHSLATHVEFQRLAQALEVLGFGDVPRMRPK